MSHRRPELDTAPQLHYAGAAVKAYARSSRIQLIQRQMTVRALEMLRLPKGRRCLLLDIGCGNCLSGEMLQYKGHDWIGCDISREMLLEAKERERCGVDDDDADGDEGNSGDNDMFDDDDEVEEIKFGYENPEREAAKFHNPLDDMDFKCNVIENDMGAGLPFRPGVFDGAVSISALQWLLVASSRDQIPERRIKRFFQSLQSCLAPGARAALQFYPQNKEQIDKLTIGATQCGFSGGVVVDFPHSSKARKYYLVIYSGHPGASYEPARPLTAGDEYGEDFGGEDNDDAQDKDNNDDDDDDNGEGNAEDRFLRQQLFGQHVPQAESERVQVYGGGAAGNAKRRRQQRESAMKKRRLDMTGRPEAGSKEWVLMKKAQRRNRGERTTEDSKYTMRRRKPKF